MRLYDIFALFKYVEMWIKIKILSAQAEKIMRIIIYGGSVNNFSEVFVMDFSFNLYNAMAGGGVCLSLQKILAEIPPFP